MTTLAGLSDKSRKDLLKQAEGLGVERPNRMTMVELRDEIIRRTTSPEEREEARGLFGVARSMLASVVESGLNLPDAAKLIRGEGSVDVPVSSQTPVATVTLAEIYAAQGHRARALRVLEDVLKEEPDHQEALRVYAELLRESGRAQPSQGDGLNDPTREAETRAAPLVQELPGATTEYVPGGFVETTGEEVDTGKPPEVALHEPAAEPPSAAKPRVENPISPPVEAEIPRAAHHEGRDEAASAQSSEPHLLLIQSEADLTLYWELSHDSEASSSVLIKVVGFAPCGTSPERQEKSVAISGRVGHVRLTEFSSPKAVRAALGEEQEEGFVPLVVGRFIEEYAGDPSNGSLLSRALRI